MKTQSALSKASAGGDASLIRAAGCIACWRYHNRIALRACGKPNPILIAA